MPSEGHRICFKHSSPIPLNSLNSAAIFLQTLAFLNAIHCANPLYFWEITLILSVFKLAVYLRLCCCCRCVLANFLSHWYASLPAGVLSLNGFRTLKLAVCCRNLSLSAIFYIISTMFFLTTSSKLLVFIWISFHVKC